MAAAFVTAGRSERSGFVPSSTIQSNTGLSEATTELVSTYGVGLRVPLLQTLTDEGRLTIFGTGYTVTFKVKAVPLQEGGFVMFLALMV